MKLNENKCEFEVNGTVFTNRGAYVDKSRALVYVVSESTGTNLTSRRVKITDWNGNTLGYGAIFSEWRLRNMDRMVSVRFTIDNVVYSGRFNWDGGQLVRAKRVNSNVRG